MKYAPIIPFPALCRKVPYAEPLWATVGLCELASANVVGYASGTTTSGFKILGAQFSPTAGSGIDLNSIKVVGYDPEVGTEAEVQAQPLDNRGKGGMTYSFYDVPGELYGWLDSNDEPVEDGTVVLSPGEGLWVSAPNATLGLQTAGAVPQASYAVVLRQGFKMVVNSSPVAIDLAKIAVSGYSADVGTEAEIQAQPLDNRGKGGMTYSFYDVPGELFGWLDSNDEPVEDGTVMIQPGEGLWVSSPNASFQLELPGVNNLN